MRRDAGKWLEDALTEGSDALEFLDGKSQADYLADKGLRAMVERKLFVVGEAISQLRTHFPEVTADLPDVREIVGFHNMLAHGYLRLSTAAFTISRQPRSPNCSWKLVGHWSASP